MNLVAFALLNGLILLIFLFFGIENVDVKLSSLFFTENQGWSGKNSIIQFLFYKLGAVPGLLLATASIFFILSGNDKNKHAKLALFAFILGPGVLVNGLLKVWNERPRPRQIIQFEGKENFLYPLSKWNYSPDKQSFPSGHASIAFYTALTGLLFFKQHATKIFFTGIGFGIFMGIARVSVGGHFLTDILGSLFFTLLPYFLLSPKSGLLYKP